MSGALTASSPVNLITEGHPYYEALSTALDTQCDPLTNLNLFHSILDGSSLAKNRAPFSGQ